MPVRQITVSTAKKRSNRESDLFFVNNCANLISYPLVYFDQFDGIIL